MKVDICVATKNSFQTLPKLINSIKSQILKTNSRLLIADGSSSDKTKEYLSEFNFCKIISHSDNSPEEAINKLLKFESPSILKILVGSDDWLSEEYLNTFKTEAEKLLNKGIYKFVLIPKFYKNIGTNLLKIDLPIPLFFLNFIGIGRGIGWGIYNNEELIPLLGDSFHIASDYDYLLKCLKLKYYFKYVPCKYFHLKNGRSSKNWRVGLNEEREIGLKYSENFIYSSIINFLYLLKLIYKLFNEFIQKS